MNTFKQLMGFVLMGTVVFILYFLDEEYIIHALVLLVSLGFSCWWISRIPYVAALRQRLQSWFVASAVVAATAVGLFVVLPMTSLNELPWEPFTRATLDEYVAQGNTVLVDFTADW